MGTKYPLAMIHMLEKNPPNKVTNDFSSERKHHLVKGIVQPAMFDIPVRIT